MTRAARPPVTIYALGGTIAMTATAGQGAVPRLTARELVSAVPGLGRLASIHVRDFRRLPGAHLREDDLAALARAILDGRRPAVVTQGTDTIEETAFALDLLVAGRVPVAVTGAMRHPGLAGPDGPANLAGAVAAATAPGARRAGAVVVMNDRIHAAALARKTHTSAPDAFASPTLGPIGLIAEGTAHFVLGAPVRARIPLPARPLDTRPVALVTSHLGDDGTLLRAAAREDLAGVVIAGMGGGHLSPEAADAAAALARRIPVVLASRAGAGPVLRRTYGFTGSEIDLARRRLIGAGWLDPPKARILLALARRGGLDRRRLRGAFAAYGGG